MKKFLVMKLVEGRTLFCLRRGESADQVKAAEVAKGINVVKVTEL